MNKQFILLLISVTMTLSAQAGTILKMANDQFETQKYSSELFFASSDALGVNEKTEFIVQYKSHVTEINKAELNQNGISVLGYLPEDALVVRMNQQDAISLTHDEQVNAVIPYLAYLKMSKNFKAMSVFNASQTLNVLVQVFDANENEQIAQKMEQLGALVFDNQGKFILANMSISTIAKIAEISGVEHLEPAPVFKTMMFDPEFSELSIAGVAKGDYSDLNGFETGTKIMNLEYAWQLGLTGKGQIASMADTGLDTGNTRQITPDFDAAIIKGYAMGLFSKSWEDPQGHGTHVAGSVLGRGAHSSGKLKGSAFEAKMIAEGLWSPMLNNLSIPTKLADLFAKAYDDGARVHTNSWGSVKDFGAYDGFARTVDEFMFNNPEMLVLFAAGNSGVDKNMDGRIDPGSVSSPGTAKNVLTVGASENETQLGGVQVPISKLRAGKDNWGAEPIYSSLISDNRNGLAMFSSRGPTQDGRTKPEIVAPGTNILSVRSHVKDASVLWGAYNDEYAWAGGTSMATPLTAGAAVLARQFLIEKRGVAQPSGALVKAALLHTAFDMYPGQYGQRSSGQELTTRRPNSDEGYGRVDMKALATMGSQTTIVDNKAGVSQGEELGFKISVSKSGKILANLVWTDAPGSPNAAKALVNNLDLELSCANGRVSIKNTDDINNNEVIETNVPAGQCILKVKGTNVPEGRSGKQPFALIYSI